MSDLQRLAVLAGVALAAAAVGYLAKRLPGFAKTIPPEVGPFPAVFLFGSATCASCQPVAARLREERLRVRTFEWEAHPELFEQLDVAEVPWTIGVDDRGRVAVQVHGMPSAREVIRLRRFSELHESAE